MPAFATALRQLLHRIDGRDTEIQRYAGRLEDQTVVKIVTSVTTQKPTDNRE